MKKLLFGYFITNLNALIMIKKTICFCQDNNILVNNSKLGSIKYHNTNCPL